MKSKQLGNTGVQIPELALGTWQYRGGVEPLGAGIELGASYIDTAELYGTEAVVGQAIRGIRDRIFLASTGRRVFTLKSQHSGDARWRGIHCTA